MIHNPSSDRGNEKHDFLFSSDFSNLHVTVITVSDEVLNLHDEGISEVFVYAMEVNIPKNCILNMGASKYHS